MGATTYSKCIRFIEDLLDNGVKELDHLHYIAVLSKLIGSDPRTVKNATNLMVMHGMIKPSRKGYKLCRIENT